MRRRVVQLLLSATVVGVAITGAASEKSDQTGEVSIESAKREFENLRGSAGLPPESRLRLPQISGPQMPLAEEPSPAMMPTQKARLEDKQKKERSENWLLDAMLERPENETEKDSLTKEQEDLRADPFQRMIAEQLRPTKESEEEDTKLAEADQLADEVINPLSAFMAGWVSERDRALLVPEAKPTAGEGWLDGSATESLSSSLRSTTSYTPMASDIRGFSAKEELAEANPYLDFQTPVFKQPVNRAPTQFIPPNFSEATQRSTPERLPVPSSPKPVAPLINRDDEAEKYFPQLKRF